MNIRIFLSHSASDEALATALVDCLLSCMILKDEEIRCTSVPGHKLPVGSETAATLRDELGDTSIVIGLLTPKAIASGWVLFELGASWGARKNLVPFLAGGLAFKDLPGPLSGHHAVRLSDKNGLAQAVEEISTKIRAKTRTAAKKDAAIAKLAGVADQYEKTSETESPPKRLHKLPPEPTFAGVPFLELIRLLDDEKVKVPPEISGEAKAVEISLAEVLLANYQTFGGGVQSNWGANEVGGFLYHKVGLALLPYGLVQFEKLPASQAKGFKRLVLSPDGKQFVLHWKRLQNPAVSEKKR
jgi:hypothetical protein